MSLALLIIVIAAVSFGGWRWSLHKHPYAPCRWCKGGRNAGSTRSKFGFCKHCGGSNRRLRWGAKEGR